MKTGNRISFKKLGIAAGLLAAFVVWTVLVRLVDVQAIGPEGSEVGFATLNGWFHRTVGVHMSLYNITDLISILPLAIIAGFGILGLIQLVRRKSLLKVDRDILALGGFYLVVLAVFLLFEVLDVNFRPVLIEGVLEASYPSSHTMLSCTLLGGTILAAWSLFKNKLATILITVAAACLLTATVACRLLSGVHWITDIIAGVLLSAVLVALYAWMLDLAKEKN